MSEAANDVTLDVPDRSFLEADVVIQGVVLMGNGGNKDSAYLARTYPTVELLNFGNLDFGATIVEPEKGLPGLVPVNTVVKFKVQWKRLRRNKAVEADGRPQTAAHRLTAKRWADEHA